MSIDHRHHSSASADGLAARSAMLARVQEQLSSRRRSQDRRCPLCGEAIRNGQACISLHGTAVHERCRSASR